MTHDTHDDFDIDHLQELAALQLDESNRAQLEGHLRRVLGYVRQLAEIDTSEVEETRFLDEVCGVLREDVVEPPLGTDRALSPAPSRSGDFFDVPRALGEEDGP